MISLRRRSRSPAGDQAALSESEGVTVRLRDGRLLGYAEYGDPDGAPVFYFHGTPGSRLGAAFLSDEARRRGVRVVGVDRPGYGMSDYLPGRQFHHWPGDLVQLADALGFERFAVVGLSGGGPHVIACAALIPERLTAAAIMSGAGPIDAYIARSKTRLGRLLRRAGLPFARLWVRPTVWSMRWSLSRTPASRMARFVDRRVLSRPNAAKMFRRDVIEALRPGGRGAIQEFTLHTRPWRAKLDAIPMRVHLWHGDDDKIVQIDIGRYVAARIPDCEARFLHNEGHLLFVDHLQELFIALKAR